MIPNTAAAIRDFLGVYDTATDPKVLDAAAETLVAAIKADFLSSPETEKALAQQLHYEYDHGYDSGGGAEACLSCKATAPAILQALRESPT